MLKENYWLLHRFENILKINCYDKTVLQREECIQEKAEIRRLTKILEPQIKAKEIRESKGLVVPLHKRLKQFEYKD